MKNYPACKELREHVYLLAWIQWVSYVYFGYYLFVYILGEDFRENAKAFKDSLRLSYGAGVVLRLGRIARLELNYVWPLWLLPGDRWVDIVYIYSQTCLKQAVKG